jgi:hypothetical protein
MKRFAAVAIALLLSSTSFAAKQQPSYWDSLSLHHIKKSITSTTTKTVNGIKSVMHLDGKHAK